MVSAEATTSDASDTTLAAVSRGVGPTVVAVHGFAQTRDCLGPLGDALGGRFHLVAPDAPGHGGSLRHAEAGLAEGADLLVHTGGHAAYVGYSMGGRLCVQAALDHPDRVTALVLIGATAGIDDETERAARQRADAALADRLEAIGLEAFLTEWLALEMFTGLPDWARFEQERRTNTAEGLATSLRRAGTGSMRPLWDRLGRVGAPVLLVTGERDERYGRIADRMAAALGPAARHEVIADAGHAAHLERPERTTELVCGFLEAALDPAQPPRNNPAARSTP
jgi:2-succinyl-6-hydroxy-2,4-cyclohexadiene-1-carboxylate synthase